MSTKEYPSYAALGNPNTRTKTQQSFFEKITVWFHDFLENAE